MRNRGLLLGPRLRYGRSVSEEMSQWRRVPEGESSVRSIVLLIAITSGQR